MGNAEYTTEPLPALPLDVAANVAARPPQCLPLPRVRRIIRTPSFSRDGVLMAAPGYHPAVEAIVDLRGFEVPITTETPTPADVTAARDLLFEVVCDVPFEGDADRAAWLAGLVTLAVRELFDGPAPLFAFEASTPGTGKGLLFELVRIIMMGPGAEYAGLALAPREEKENQQRVLAALASSPTVVMLDNLPDGGLVASAVLESVLTSTSHTGRILGESRIATFPNAATWFATGNNLRWSSAMTSRVVSCRLAAPCERPRERTGFRHPLPAWAIERRADLVAAVLTLVQAWLAAGRPAGNATMGSFEGWASTVSGILETAGVPDLLGNRDELFDRADDEGATWRPFVLAWAEEYGTAPTAVGDLARLASDRELLGDVLRGEPGRGYATSLGRHLRKYEGRVFAGWRIGRVKPIAGHRQGCSLKEAGGLREPRELSGTLHTRETENEENVYVHAFRGAETPPEAPKAPCSLTSADDPWWHATDDGRAWVWDVFARDCCRAPDTPMPPDFGDHLQRLAVEGVTYIAIVEACGRYRAELEAGAHVVDDWRRVLSVEAVRREVAP